MDGGSDDEHWSGPVEQVIKTIASETASERVKHKVDPLTES